MMGGFNGAQNYYEEHMHFGHPKEDGTPKITDEILQGGILSWILSITVVEDEY